MKFRTPMLRQLAAAVITALALFPLVVLAQTAEPLPDNGHGTLLTVGYIVGMGILSGAGLLLAWWLAQKAKTSKTFALLQQLWLIAQTTVAHVEAKIRPTIKAALADGNLDANERAQIQKEALAAFKESIGPDVLSQLQKLYGNGSDNILSGMLEWALKRFKSDADAPSSTPATISTSP